MNKVIIVTEGPYNKVIAVYAEDANIPELYKQKKDRYKVKGYDVRNGIQYESEMGKFALPPDNLSYFEK